MLSFGTFSFFAARMAVLSLGLPSGSPPDLAASVISLRILVNSFPRLASIAPFFLLIVLHLEWPDIIAPPVFYKKMSKKIQLG
jgi:hypothetical protein